MRLFFLLLTFFCYSNTTVSANEFSIKPRLLDDELYSETFTLFADLENGQYIYAQLGISNIGPGDQNGICRIMIFNPNEDTVNKSVVIDDSEWHYNHKPFPSLNVGLCKLSSSGHSLIFSGEIDDITANIHLNNEIADNLNTISDKEVDEKIPNHTVPVSKIEVGQSQYFSEILYPWSRASASSSLITHSATTTPGNHSSNKNEPQLLSGYGYADHSISTLLPKDIASRWIRFRSINQSDSHLILIRYPDLTQKSNGWMWNQETSVESITSVSFNTNSLPIINIETSQNSDVNYAINAKHLIYRQAPLEEKGLLGKVLSQLIGNPVTYTYRASMTAQSGIEISGILEVSVANE